MTTSSPASPSPLVASVEEFVRVHMASNDASHDWSHTHRVRTLALSIAREEQKQTPAIDLELVELGALFHDVGDYKYASSTDAQEDGVTLTTRFLRERAYPEEKIAALRYILENVSFHSEVDGKTVELTPELACVQDADRLEAIGAIGVARCMTYTGRKGRPFYDTAYEHEPRRYQQECQKLKPGVEYLARGSASDNSAIAHFYEKLVHLQSMLKTATGQRMGAKRHAFMLEFLEQFFAEWEAST